MASRSLHTSLPKCGVFVGGYRTFSSTAYDVAVIGGGPGGYVASIKAAQLGLKTVCIEKRGTLGGTCLNVGCIPSKSLLNISHKYHELKHMFPKMGIKVEGPVSIDVAAMQQQKSKSVQGLTAGIEFLLKKNKVDYIKGSGKLKSATEISVTGLDGKTTNVSTKNIILATGSEPSPMPGGTITADEKTIVTSTGALALEKVPSKMVVIGGGVIGLELGSVWNRLGAEVEVVEYLDRICPSLDHEIVANFKKILEKQGMKFHLSTKVVGVESTGQGVTVFTEPAAGGAKSSIQADVVLLSVGRRPYTKGLGLEDLGIVVDKAGRVVVGDDFTVPNFKSIRAIGDLIHGPMLAHKAEEDGIACVELIAKKGSGHVNYATVPNVIYTHPEVAGVGATEQQLKEQGVNYKKGSFPMAANSRARTNDDFEGMVKVLTDKDTDRVLGAWIVGTSAGDLIQEVVLGMEYGASSEDIARTCHAHPTLSEAVKEACMITGVGSAIHFA